MPAGVSKRQSRQLPFARSPFAPAHFIWLQERIRSTRRRRLNRRWKAALPIENFGHGRCWPASGGCTTPEVFPHESSRSPIVGSLLRHPLSPLVGEEATSSNVDLLRGRHEHRHGHPSTALRTCSLMQQQPNQGMHPGALESRLSYRGIRVRPASLGSGDADVNTFATRSRSRSPSGCPNTVTPTRTAVQLSHRENVEVKLINARESRLHRRHLRQAEAAHVRRCAGSLAVETPGTRPPA